MELLISLLIIVNVIDNNRMGFSWLRRDVAVVCETGLEGKSQCLRDNRFPHKITVGRQFCLRPHLK